MSNFPLGTTPAKAGVQLANVADQAVRSVTSTSQLDPGLRRGGGNNWEARGESMSPDRKRYAATFCGWCGTRISTFSSTRHDASRDRKFIPSTLVSPNAGDTTT